MDKKKAKDTDKKSKNLKENEEEGESEREREKERESDKEKRGTGFVREEYRKRERKIAGINPNIEGVEEKEKKKADTYIQIETGSMRVYVCVRVCVCVFVCVCN